jgi:hypothetical protein
MMAFKQTLTTDFRNRLFSFSGGGEFYGYKIADNRAYPIRRIEIPNFDSQSNWISLSQHEIFVCGGGDETHRESATVNL